MEAGGKYNVKGKLPRLPFVRAKEIPKPNTSPLGKNWKPNRELQAMKDPMRVLE